MHPTDRAVRPMGDELLTALRIQSSDFKSFKRSSIQAVNPAKRLDGVFAKLNDSDRGATMVASGILAQQDVRGAIPSEVVGVDRAPPAARVRKSVPSRKVIELRPGLRRGFNTVDFENRLSVAIVEDKTIGSKNQGGGTRPIQRGAIEPQAVGADLLVAGEVRNLALQTRGLQNEILRGGGHIPQSGRAPPPLNSQHDQNQYSG